MNVSYGDNSSGCVKEASEVESLEEVEWFGLSRNPGSSLMMKIMINRQLAKSDRKDLENNKMVNLIIKHINGES